MKYLIGFFIEGDAEMRSRVIAQEQGCFGDITEYWYGVYKHYARAEWALVIPQGEENKLTQEEQDDLKTQQECDDDGWFPPPIPYEE